MSLNNALIQTDNSVTRANYVNASASQGIWIVTSIVNNAKGSAIQTWVWIVEPASALDILAYYKGLGDDPGTVEYADIQSAIDDWISKTTPAGFTDSITYQELLTLIYKWL